MTRKFTCLWLYLVLTGVNLHAQYEITDPSVKKRESYEFSVKSVKVFPEKLTLNFEWANRGKGRTVRASTETRFQIASFSSELFPIADRYNINANSSPIPDGDYLKFSLSVRVPLYQLLEKHMSSRTWSREFFMDGVMFIDYLDCTDAFRRSNNISTGNCWNIYGIHMKLPLAKWNAIYSYGKLESKLQKDEFETTQQYKTRTSAAGLSEVFEESVEYFAGICERAFEIQMMSTKPQLEYNADEQIFTVTYPGAVPAKIKVPGDKARDFKEDLLSGRLKLARAYMKINSAGKYLLETLTFEQGESLITYENILTTEEEILQLEIEYKKKVLSELKWLQSQNGARAVF